MHLAAKKKEANSLREYMPICYVFSCYFGNIESMYTDIIGGCKVEKIENMIVTSTQTSKIKHPECYKRIFKHNN